MIFLAGHMQPTTITCQRKNCEFFFFSELNPCTNKESDNFEKLSPVFLKSFQHVYPKVTPKVRLMAGPLIRVPLKNELILTQFILFLSFLSD